MSLTFIQVIYITVIILNQTASKIVETLLSNNDLKICSARQLNRRKTITKKNVIIISLSLLWVAIEGNNDLEPAGSEQLEQAQQ